MNDSTTTRRGDSTPRVALFIDLVALAFRHSSDARAVAEHARSIGLRPGPLHGPRDSRRSRLDEQDDIRDEDPAAVRVSLAPAWSRPDDLAALLQDAERRRATIYRIDVALDVLGHDADRARRVFFPSSTRRRLTVASDIMQVRPEWTRQTRWRAFRRSSYVGTERSDVSATVYSHRRSKLDSADGAPVLHWEIRAQFDALPDDFRCSPTNVCRLFDAEECVQLVAQYIAPKKTLSPSTARVFDVLTREQSSVSVPELAKLARVSVSTAYRCLRQLHTDGSVQTVDRRGGRGRVAERRLAHSSHAR